MKRKVLLLIIYLIGILVIIPNRVNALNSSYNELGSYILADQTSNTSTTTSSISDEDFKKLVGKNNLCDKDGELRKLFNNVWTIICIFMPPLIILMCSVDFFKAITTSDDDGIKKAANKSLKRALSFILLLMLRFILNTLFGWVNLPLCL